MQDELDANLLLLSVFERIVDYFFSVKAKIGGGGNIVAGKMPALREGIEIFRRSGVSPDKVIDLYIV